MARPARIAFEGAFYHVMNRGNRREDIFLDTRRIKRGKTIQDEDID